MTSVPAVEAAREPASAGPMDRSARAFLTLDLTQEVAAGELARPQQFVGALRTLLGDEEALPLLERLAKETSEPDVRLRALEELASVEAGREADSMGQTWVSEVLSWPDAADSSAAALLDAGPDTHRAAVSCWARARNRTGLEGPLRARLAAEGQPGWLRRSFLRTLAVVGNEHTLSALPAMLRSEELLTARTAIGAVVAIGSPMGVGLLGKLLQERRGAIQADLVRALLILDPERGSAPLASLAADPEPAIRAAALHLVRTFSPAAGSQILLSRLEREEEPTLLEPLALALYERPTQEVAAGVAHAARQGESPRARTCRALLARFVEDGKLDSAAALRAHEGYSPGANPGQ
ncbi:MAG: hypothetical protein HYY25_10665 [Candidatus Wallbacteria bacterium]|nr:hypothetical protein [Candidatus Wallbacteria bacterium]